MLFSSPLLKEGALVAKGRIPYPKVAVFSEVIPLASKNKVSPKRSRAAASSCTAELQALFGCLRKWEYDDAPCKKENSLYTECVQQSAKAAAEYKEQATKGTLGEGSSSSLTSAQFNKLMSLFPTPGLGNSSRQMKRLPSQPYHEDIYHRKSSGKPS